MSVKSFDNPAYLKDIEEEVADNRVDKNSQEENKAEDTSSKRPQWGNEIQFVMSCIAMNVGLGNIWRFPFVAYENGGGAFLIPYLLVLIFFGRPMYYLEMCLGQFSSRGNVKMFESLAPVLKGIGYGQIIGVFAVATYYCSIMAISLYYLAQSFTSNLPWSTCDPAWENHPLLEGNLTCVPSNYEGTVSGNKSVSSSELYFRIEVLNEVIDIEEGIGLPNWRLSLCLLASWTITYIVCAKGIKSSGKASYFLALFPYVILLALLIRAVTLDGSDQGILYFITPKWEMLLEAKVWYAAITQCIFSLNIGFGTVTMYASYNNFHHNAYRDAMIVATLDTFTSMLGGTIIFGILGNLAAKLNVPIDDVVTSGTGLAFISYPEAIAKFDVIPWLFAILFFLMLFILGVGSLVALKGSAFTVIMDSYPHLKIEYVSLCTAIVGFIIGLVYITPGGQWIFTMVDFYAGNSIFFVLNIFEIIAIAWWYGLEEICSDVKYMLKRETGAYWRLTWGFIIPVTLLAVVTYFIITIEPLRYEGKLFPFRIEVWGYILFASGLLQPFIWFFIEFFWRKNRRRSIREVFGILFSHSEWGPKDPNKNKEWKDMKQKVRSERASKRRSFFVDKLCILIGK